MMDFINRGVYPGMRIQGDRVQMGPMILRNLILDSYRIRANQLVGPEWLTATPPQLFEIDAKMPAGATRDQVPAMLQALLAERFKLVTHKGTKEAESYAITVSRNGHRLQPAIASTEPQVAPPAAPASPTGPRTLRIGDAKVTIDPGNPTHVEASTLAGLLGYLTVQLAPEPVLDNTGLQGTFDIQLDVPPPDPLTPRATAAAAVDDTVDRWRVALAKVGLQLDRVKSPVETLVIESVEKMPTEN
jgi:uncharacterized protein (TIGR03435 family)